jgi:hypothetical protein
MGRTPNSQQFTIYPCREATRQLQKVTSLDTSKLYMKERPSMVMMVREDMNPAIQGNVFTGNDKLLTLNF